jgi:hypothetical protein
MSCDVKYDDIIFTIYKKSRISKDEYNVFIGKVNNNIENILKKLEKREGVITKDDQIILKKTYPKYFNQWIQIVKNKNIKLKFIFIKIHIDDNISDIKKKIFVYMSNTETKDYILPENIELWLEKEDKGTELIGYFYEDKNTGKKENFKPSIYEIITAKLLETKIDYTLLKKNTSENNILIYDILNQNNYIKNIIYMCDAKDDEKYLQKLKIQIKDNIINNYFKKYWPYVNLKYNIDEVIKNYVIFKDYYEKEIYINNLIDNTHVSNSIFGSCNIQTIYFKVADEVNIENEKLHKEEIDLFQILDYLKDNQLNDKMPYIKYSEEDFETPFILISKKAISDGLLDKATISDWLGLNDKDNVKKINGISLKRYSKDYNDKPKYYSVLLNKYGVLQITVSYLNENKANFSDVEYAMNDCRHFIETVNRNRIVKKVNEKAKIQLPEFKYKDGNIITNKYTNIIFMIISIPLNLSVPLDFKNLYEFSKKFPYFIVDTPKNILKTDKNEKDETSLKIRYKRISGFVNMNDILLDIDKLKEKSVDNGLIIKLLQKKYERSVEEIKSYIIEWERKYSSSKSSKISSEFKQGILVTITNSKILVHGITKTYQISLIYKFFTTFLNIFINYDNYIKEKEFKKVFTGKNTNNNNKIYENSYEYNNNVVLNIEKINYTNYDIDEFYENEVNNNQAINDDIYNTGIDNENKNKQLITQYSPKIEGMASLDQVGSDIVLKCEDAIPEKATCGDFCNDDYYFIRRLQLYDIKLFKPNKGIKGKYEKYTKSCQAKRQPVVLAVDPEKDPRIKRDSYTYAMKYSSDPNTFQRWYICPKIWCPYCEIPISETDIDKSTMKLRATKEKSRMCKTVVCPFGNHLAYVKDKDAENEIYPGFISKNVHPNGLCLPCCFKKPKNKPKTIDYIRMRKCMGEEDENVNFKLKDSQIYILGKGVPIDKNRYGKLHIELERLLKTNLETGYLGNKSGYLRKGISHVKNNSFLSAISDVISCDKKNINMDVYKIKSMILNKLNDTLFKSLYQGNLPNIFFTIENFKKYILNDNIVIEHKYLWDFLQRENILTDEGVNIFIFENNNLICPKGENVNFFFDKNKKSILLFKFNQYYEPIYYLEGNGKTAIINCLFDYNREEIKKIFDISMEGCKDYYDINWIEVLKHNMMKYNFKVDNLTISNGYDLQTVLNELLIAIKNKKLDQKFLPKVQYMDTYYKVFGLMLNNGLYLPISPCKLNDKLDFKLIIDMNDINKLSIKDTIKLTDQISKNTNLKNKITFKVLDLKNKKTIIALLNEYNRFIPVLNEKDNIKNIKVADINYFSDIEEYIYDGAEMLDNRIEIMNKKKFEDETYMRLKFELSKFINYKENKSYYDKILEIINSNEKDINKNRIKMFSLLNSIFKLLISTKNKDINYYDYKTPNKRIPCSIRSINNNSNNNNNSTKLGCHDDPHCIKVNNECKLFLNNINLIDKDRKIDNYDFYISKIIDELLRFKLKRNEILNDNIPIIIDKKIIVANPKKYIVIKTVNKEDIQNIIEKVFLDNNGIIIDTQNLYEDVSTNDIGFKKNKFLKVRVKELNESKSDYLSTYWIKILGFIYTVKLNVTDSLLFLLLNIINSQELKNNSNNKLIDVNDLKNIIIKYINERKNKNDILTLYSKMKSFKNIPDIDLIKEKILSEEYKGTEADLNIISRIFNINFVILDKRSKKNDTNIKIIKSNNYKSDYFVLLYKTKIGESYIYNLIQSKGKIIFKMNYFPPKFINLIEGLNKVTYTNTNK